MLSPLVLRHLDLMDSFSINDIGRRIKEATCEKQATSYLMQAIGTAIQRGNNQCILGPVKDTRKMDEVFLLTMTFSLFIIQFFVNPK